MKNISVITLVIIVILSLTFYSFDGGGEEEQEVKVESICPKTKIQGDVHDCLKCHVRGNFGVIETDTFSTWDLPGTDSYMIMEDSRPVAVYDVNGYISGSIGTRIDELFQYLSRMHPEVRKVVISIHSGGGSMFGSYQAYSVLQDWSTQYEIETHVHGFAASAAFYIFCGGETRLVGKSAQLMWHSLKVFKMFDVASPDSKEEEARVLRHLQDAANTILEKVSTLSKDEIDEKIKYKELWVGAEKAIEYGFATGYIR